ncbi:hypothetical protein BT93_H1431 [Corymbia citriodora subsp. variegata]|nr:hypothetical protein BT93_H1431 [Corymbia citriodora subsp. variegata]
MSSLQSKPLSHSQGYTVDFGFPVNHLQAPPPPPPPPPPPSYSAATEEHRHLVIQYLSLLGRSMQLLHNAFCPCVTFGRIAVFADGGSSSCVAKGTLYCLAAALTCCFLGGARCCGCYNRGSLRTQFIWKQSACGDCCVHCFCHRCALCQEYRHLQSLGYDPSKGWEGNRQMHDGARGMTPPLTTRNMSRQS